MTVLVVNAGGVTLEVTVVDEGNSVIDRVQLDQWDGLDIEPIAELAGRHRGLTAVGHRIVHGGVHSQPTVIDDTIIGDLEHASDLAPIRQERALLTVSAARTRLPTLPHVACFDTTFHRTIPAAAAVYALPGVATAMVTASHWLPWPLARARCPHRPRHREWSREPSDCQLPSRLRRVCVRDRRRSIDRHHHGDDASGRPYDGHPIGERRPWHGDLAARQGPALIGRTR